MEELLFFQNLLVLTRNREMKIQIQIRGIGLNNIVLALLLNLSKLGEA